MAENKILISLEVDDKGTVKIKQFSDESRKAFDEMKKGPEQAKGPLAQIQEGWIGLTAKIGIATVAFYAAKRVIYDTAKEIASAGNDIQRMSSVLNMSTEDFQKWSYVAKMADVDTVGFGDAFKFLTRSMGEALQGSGDASKAFNLLKIDLKDSTGKTKNQQTVMMETIDTLGKYADGVNRDALMLAIFGRGWMSIKPLIDQGTKAIEENKREAERLGFILGKDLIKSLSESEDSFKRWSMTWKITKMEVLEPAVVILGSMLERILALKKAWSEGGISGIYREVLAGQEEARIEHLPPAAWTKEWVAGWTPTPAKTKPEAPELDPFVRKYGLTEAELAERMARSKLAYQGWLESYIAGTETEYTRLEETYVKIRDGFFKLTNIAVPERGIPMEEYLRPTLITYEDIERQLAAFGTTLGEDKIQITEFSDSLGQNITVVKKAEDYYKSLKDRMDELLNTAELISTVRMAPGGPWTGAEFTFPTEDILPDWMSHPKTGKPVQVQQWKDEVNQMKDYFIQFSQNISSVWAENVKGIISQGKSLGDALKNIFTGMADVFVSAIAKMIANWVLFGSIKGAVSGAETGVGILGWLAKGIRISTWQEGGIVNRPTLSMIGEGGPEAVIPLKSGKIPIEGGGQTITNIYYVNAIDTQSFDLAIRRNSGSIVKVVKGNIDRNGPLRGK